MSTARHIPKVLGVAEFDELNEAQRVAVQVRLQQDEDDAYKERVRGHSITVKALAPDALNTELSGSPLGQKFLAEQEA